MRKSADTQSWVKWTHHSQGPNCCQECLMLDGCRVVLFPQYVDKEDIADLYIHEEDLILLPEGMDARVNGRIKAQHENSSVSSKPLAGKTDDLEI